MRVMGKRVGMKGHIMGHLQSVKVVPRREIHGTILTIG